HFTTRATRSLDKLGMTICKHKDKIPHLHSGNKVVPFWVTGSASMNASAKSPTAQTLVVVVEDNIPAKDLLCDWLKLSYRVEAYLDGESAAAACKGSEELAVFLLDYNLPGINGIDLKHKLQPLYPKSKFVLVSGLFDQQLTNRAQSAGFDLLLPKPFS